MKTNKKPVEMKDGKPVETRVVRTLPVTEADFEGCCGVGVIIDFPFDPTVEDNPRNTDMYEDGLYFDWDKSVWYREKFDLPDISDSIKKLEYQNHGLNLITLSQDQFETCEAGVLGAGYTRAVEFLNPNTANIVRLYFKVINQPKPKKPKVKRVFS